VHFRDCALRIVYLFVQNVCGAAVDVEDGVHGHAQVFDGAVFAEDFADVGFFDVACQGFHDNLRDEISDG
jgi:hypothetical protein